MTDKIHGFLKAEDVRLNKPSRITGDIAISLFFFNKIDR